MKMLFQLHNGAKPVLPELPGLTLGIGKSLVQRQLRMNVHDEHFLVGGAVEDSDPSPLRKPVVGPPKKGMLQFLRARLLERVHLTTLWIDSGHDVTDRAVFPRRIHSLKDEQQRVAIGRGVQTLQVA